jgi:hypothetical protein
MKLKYNSFFTRYGYFHFAYLEPDVGALAEIPLVGTVRVGILFQPVCHTGTKHPIVILECDPILRDYILLSQTAPSQLPPLPPSLATWSVTNLKNQNALDSIELSITVPDNSEDLHYKTSQKGCDLFLGVRTPKEFSLSLEVSGTVLGSIYVDFPLLLPPPPIFSSPPPPPIYSNVIVDGSFPPGFEYPPDFLWPSQVNTFYHWSYVMYGDTPLPPLEMLPYIPAHQLT